jgi:hypothetical protein
VTARGDAVAAQVSGSEALFISADVPYLKKAFNRLAAQEIRRQKNMENVLLEAGHQPVNQVAEEGVSDDWLANFFGACQDVPTHRSAPSGPKSSPPKWLSQTLFRCA